jgi:hypothetical protein
LRQCTSMNTTIDSAPMNRGTNPVATNDPLRMAMRWLEENEPLARMLEVTSRACADPTVFVPAAVRLVYARGQPNWHALGLSGTRDTRKCLEAMACALAVLEGLASWSAPALREGLERCTEDADAARLWRWTTVLVFGDQVDCEPATGLAALGRAEVLRRLRASLAEIRQACLVG